MIHKHKSLYTKGFFIGKVSNRKIFDITIDRDIQLGLSSGLYVECSNESPLFVGITLFGLTVWVSLFENILED